MGAGRPKSRIWLVMSAGWKFNVQSGKPLGQLLPQPGDIIGGGPVLRLERDENFTVGVADRAVVDVGADREGWRHAHVVEDHGPLVVGHDFADHVFDLAEDALGFLDPRAGRRPDVQSELAGIDRGKKVFAEPGSQQQRAQGEAEQHSHRREAVIQCPAEEPLVAGASARTGD